MIPLPDPRDFAACEPGVLHVAEHYAIAESHWRRTTRKHRLLAWINKLGKHASPQVAQHIRQRASSYSAEQRAIPTEALVLDLLDSVPDDIVEQVELDQLYALARKTIRLTTAQQMALITDMVAS